MPYCRSSLATCSLTATVLPLYHYYIYTLLRSPCSMSITRRASMSGRAPPPTCFLMRVRKRVQSSIRLTLRVELNNCRLRFCGIQFLGPLMKKLHIGSLEELGLNASKYVQSKPNKGSWDPKTYCNQV